MAPVTSEARWEHFPHDADVGVRGFGATPAAAFEQAALALTAVVTQAEVRSLAAVEVKCEAPDLELLLVDWLNTIIYEMAVRNMLFGRFAVAIEGPAASDNVGRAGGRRAPRAGLRTERRDLHRVAGDAGPRPVVGRLRRRRLKRPSWTPTA